MPFKRYRGVCPEKYTDRTGAEKTAWKPAGFTLVEDAEAHQRFMVDHRTGMKIMFYPEEEKEQGANGQSEARPEQQPAKPREYRRPAARDSWRQPEEPAPVDAGQAELEEDPNDLPF